MRRAIITLATLLLATTALAQEYGHASGGDIDLITKRPNKLSGSFGFTAGGGQGFDATLGGNLIKDRVWFFASAEKSNSAFGTPFRATDAKVNANLGDRQMLAASFADTKQSLVTTNPNLSLTMPSTFLSLHYTGIVSNNMFVTASFSELKR